MTGSLEAPISSSKVASEMVKVFSALVFLSGVRQAEGSGRSRWTRRRHHSVGVSENSGGTSWCASSQRSVSMAAMQPEPAAVMAWR